MFSITPWLEEFTHAVRTAFGGRVACIGLQGSYGRGEAGPDSDIDVVVILDRLLPQDIKTYEKVLEALPHRKEVCGFLSGRGELLGWEPSDLFQFYHDTTPVYGDLEELLPRIGPQDVQRAIRIGGCNIYHMCVHNLLHDKDPAILKGLYKSAAFVLQAKQFAATGEYLRRQRDLLPLLRGEDREILELSLALKNRDPSPEELEPLGEKLFLWAGKLIREE